MTSPTSAADAFLGQDPVPFYVDGQWTTGKHGNTIEVLRPSTGKLLGRGRLMHRTSSMAFVEGTIVDADGQVCAHATGTFKYATARNVISTD